MRIIRLEEYEKKRPMAYLAYDIQIAPHRMLRHFPRAQFIAVTELTDYRLCFRYKDFQGIPTVERHTGSRVPAVLWRITSQEAEALDELWCAPGLYHRETFKVKVSGRGISAFTYVMSGYMDLGRPHPKLYATLAAAYGLFGFDRTILDEAVEYSTLIDPEQEGLPF